MKVKIVVFLFLLNFHLNYSQNKYEWTEFGISFNSINSYDFEPSYVEGENRDSLWRLDSNEFGLEIEVSSLSEQSNAFVKNIEFAAKEIAEDMEYKPITNGEQILGDFRGFYVKSIDTDYNENIYPVLIAAIIDDKNKLAFEIVIDCYDGDLQNGIEFLNSIKYNPKD
jgi:hypothetical protein